MHQNQTPTQLASPAPPAPSASRFPPMVSLALVCLAMFVGSIDLTVVTAVLPRILSDLHVSIDTELGHAAWIITGYLLTYTVSLTFMGRLSDLLGRRVMYFVCLIIFIVGSCLVAAASSLNGVIMGRVVQAFGAGAVVPISMALVGDLFPPQQRAPALGFVAAVETVGWMIGHLYGGILMRLFDDWRLLFWINVPLGIVALGLTWWALQDIQPSKATGGFDWWGALLISGSLIALNVGLSAGSELGQTDFYGQTQDLPAYAIPLVIAALVMLAMFVWVEHRVRHPLFAITLLHQRNATIASTVNVLVGFALALAIANVPLFIHTRLELFNPYDPLILPRGAWDSGWMLSALTLTMATMAIPGGWLTNRLGAKVPMVVGLAMALVGFMLLSTWHAHTTYMVMAVELILAGVGLGLVLSPMATVVINTASEDYHGSASALVITLRLVGMTLGASVLTVWGVTRQHTLRQTGFDNPLAASDPALFLVNVAAQVIDEMFLFGVGACLLALLLALFMQRR